MTLTEQEQVVYDLLAEIGDDAKRMIALVRDAEDEPGSLDPLFVFALQLNADRARTAAVLLALTAYGLMKGKS